MHHCCGGVDAGRQRCVPHGWEPAAAAARTAGASTTRNLSFQISSERHGRAGVQNATERANASRQHAIGWSPRWSSHPRRLKRWKSHYFGRPVSFRRFWLPTNRRVSIYRYRSRFGVWLPQPPWVRYQALEIMKTPSFLAICIGPREFLGTVAPHPGFGCRELTRPIGARSALDRLRSAPDLTQRGRLHRRSPSGAVSPGSRFVTSSRLSDI